MSAREITLTVLGLFIGAVVSGTVVTKHYTEVVKNTKTALAEATDKAQSLCGGGITTGPMRMVQISCGGTQEFCLCGDPMEAVKDIDFNSSLGLEEGEF